MFSPLVKRLVDTLCYLPGVGPKSAARMALHLLERDREGGKELAEVLQKAMLEVDRCTQCRIFSETKICDICSDTKRDKKMLCIVESPAEVSAIEQSGAFFGNYFVLSGHLSPIDGIGPEEIGVEQLCELLDKGTVKEAVLATNPTVEGEATSYYLAELIKDRGIQVSRIAYGVPLGGELGMIDGGTIAKALSARSEV